MSMIHLYWCGFAPLPGSFSMKNTQRITELFIPFFSLEFFDELFNSKHKTLCTTWRYLSRSDKSDHGPRRLDSCPVKIKVWKVIWILNDPKREKSLLKNIITLPEFNFFPFTFAQRKKIYQVQSRYFIYIIIL